MMLRNIEKKAKRLGPRELQNLRSKIIYDSPLVVKEAGAPLVKCDFSVFGMCFVLGSAVGVCFLVCNFPESFVLVLFVFLVQ